MNILIPIESTYNIFLLVMITNALSILHHFQIMSDYYVSNCQIFFIETVRGGSL